jgi:molybdate transport system permease protein
MKIYLILSICLFLLIVVIFFTGLLQTDVKDYFTLIRDEEFVKAIIFTLETAIPATFFAFFSGVPIGFYLSRFEGIIPEIFDTAFDIPIVIPPLIVGVLFLSLFSNNIIPFFDIFIFNIYGAIAVQFFIAFPLTVKMAKSAFDLVPSLYENLAMTLGANYFRAIYDTTFKIAFSGIASGVILTFLRCLGEFGATLIVGGGIPGKTENIPINIYLNISAGKFEYAMAASVLMIIFAGIGLFAVKFMLNNRLIEIDNR